MDTLDKCSSEGLYPVTLHHYGGFGEDGGELATVDDWHEMGITVGKTPAQSGGNTKPIVLAMLDRCAELGMRCFVNDTRCCGQVMLNGGSEDDLRRGFEAALIGRLGHSATDQLLGPVYQNARRLPCSRVPFDLPPRRIRRVRGDPGQAQCQTVRQ